MYFLANPTVLQKPMEEFSINTELWLCQMLLEVKYDEDLKVSTVFSKMMVTGNLSESCFGRVMGGWVEARVKWLINDKY